jgi:hypothetical protein
MWHNFSVCITLILAWSHRTSAWKKMPLQSLSWYHFIDQITEKVEISLFVFLSFFLSFILFFFFLIYYFFLSSCIFYLFISLFILFLIYLFVSDWGDCAWRCKQVQGCCTGQTIDSNINNNPIISVIMMFFITIVIIFNFVNFGFYPEFSKAVAVAQLQQEK